MKTQNLIKQTLPRPESVVVVQQILVDNGEASRTAISLFFDSVVRTLSQSAASRVLGMAKRASEPILSYATAIGPGWQKVLSRAVAYWRLLSGLQLDRGGPDSRVGTSGSRQSKARDGQRDLPGFARIRFSRSNGGGEIAVRKALEIAQGLDGDHGKRSKNSALLNWAIGG